MKQILIIGNENLDEYKNLVAKTEQDKTSNLCFVAKKFISEFADETSAYILLDDNKKYSEEVFKFLDDASEYNKPVRKISVFTLGEAISHCDEVIKEDEKCTNNLFQQLQLKMWLVELQILKNRLGEEK